MWLSAGDKTVGCEGREPAEKWIAGVLFHSATRPLRDTVEGARKVRVSDAGYAPLARAVIPRGGCQTVCVTSTFVSRLFDSTDNFIKNVCEVV